MEKRVERGSVVGIGKGAVLDGSSNKRVEPDAADSEKVALAGTSVWGEGVYLPDSALGKDFTSGFGVGAQVTVAFHTAMSQRDSEVWQPLPFSRLLLSTSSSWILQGLESLHYDPDQSLPAQLVRLMLDHQTRKERLEGAVTATSHLCPTLAHFGPSHRRPCIPGQSYHHLNDLSSDSWFDSLRINERSGPEDSTSTSTDSHELSTRVKRVTRPLKSEKNSAGRLLPTDIPWWEMPVVTRVLEVLAIRLASVPFATVFTSEGLLGYPWSGLTLAPLDFHTSFLSQKLKQTKKQTIASQTLDQGRVKGDLSLPLDSMVCEGCIGTLCDYSDRSTLDHMIAIATIKSGRDSCDTSPNNLLKWDTVSTTKETFIGLASVAQATLSKGTSGNYFSINLSFGFAVMLAILVAGGTSAISGIKPETLATVDRHAIDLAKVLTSPMQSGVNIMFQVLTSTLQSGVNIMFQVLTSTLQSGVNIMFQVLTSTLQSGVNIMFQVLTSTLQSGVNIMFQVLTSTLQSGVNIMFQVLTSTLQSGVNIMFQVLTSTLQSGVNIMFQVLTSTLQSGVNIMFQVLTSTLQSGVNIMFQVLTSTLQSGVNIMFQVLTSTLQSGVNIMFQVLTSTLQSGVNIMFQVLTSTLQSGVNIMFQVLTSTLQSGVNIMFQVLTSTLQSGVNIMFQVLTSTLQSGVNIMFQVLTSTLQSGVNIMFQVLTSTLQSGVNIMFQVLTSTLQSGVNIMFQVLTSTLQSGVNIMFQVLTSTLQSGVNIMFQVLTSTLQSGVNIMFQVLTSTLQSGVNIMFQVLTSTLQSGVNIMFQVLTSTLQSGVNTMFQVLTSTLQSGVNIMFQVLTSTLQSGVNIMFQVLTSTLQSGVNTMFQVLTSTLQSGVNIMFQVLTSTLQSGVNIMFQVLTSILQSGVNIMFQVLTSTLQSGVNIMFQVLTSTLQSGVNIMFQVLTSTLQSGVNIMFQVLTSTLQSGVNIMFQVLTSTLQSGVNIMFQVLTSPLQSGVNIMFQVLTSTLQLGVNIMFQVLTSILQSGVNIMFQVLTSTLQSGVNIMFQVLTSTLQSGVNIMFQVLTSTLQSGVNIMFQVLTSTLQSGVNIMFQVLTSTLQSGVNIMFQVLTSTLQSGVNIMFQVLTSTLQSGVNIMFQVLTSTLQSGVNIMFQVLTSTLQSGVNIMFQVLTSTLQSGVNIMFQVLTSTLQSGVNIMFQVLTSTLQSGVNIMFQVLTSTLQSGVNIMFQVLTSTLQSGVNIMFQVLTSTLQSGVNIMFQVLTSTLQSGVNIMFQVLTSTLQSGVNIMFQVLTSTLQSGVNIMFQVLTSPLQSGVNIMFQVLTSTLQSGVNTMFQVLTLTLQSGANINPAVSCPYYVSGDHINPAVRCQYYVSGAHINPAVTVAFTFVGKFPKEKIFHYLIAQYLGALVASLLVFLTYYDALAEFDGGERVVFGIKETASIWATYPKEFVSIGGCFFDQVVGTFILMFVVCAVTDNINMEIHRSLYALYIGITVIVLGMSVGYNCGYPLNPARDLSPRLFLLMAGWGKQAFLYRQYWWVGIVGPHTGAILGAFTYVFFIEAQLPKKELKSHDIPLREKMTNVLEGIISQPFRVINGGERGWGGEEKGAGLIIDISGTTSIAPYVLTMELGYSPSRLTTENRDLGGHAACHGSTRAKSSDSSSTSRDCRSSPGNQSNRVARRSVGVAGTRTLYQGSVERKSKRSAVHHQLQRGAVDNEAEIMEVKVDLQTAINQVSGELDMKSVESMELSKQIFETSGSSSHKMHSLREVMVDLVVGRLKTFVSKNPSPVLFTDLGAQPRGKPRNTLINQEIDKKQKRFSWGLQIERHTAKMGKLLGVFAICLLVTQNGCRSQNITSLPLEEPTFPSEGIETLTTQAECITTTWKVILSEVKEGFGNQINLCRDRGLNPGPLTQKSDTLPLDHQFEMIILVLDIIKLVLIFRLTIGNIIAEATAGFMDIYL
uniref:Uncharacterized protein n=1 Tax=Timema bartmani TaxID=61472 RepID=A0A7R9F559_9NEOP|nr:unnamed protein product [Timema bartmani]